MSAAVDPKTATEPTPTPGDKPEVSPSVSQDKPEDTYGKRIRSDPDFAVAEVNKAKSELRKLQNRFTAQKIPGAGMSVEEMLQAVGGEQSAYQQLVRMNRYLSNPAVKAALDGFDATGNWSPKPVAASSDDDDYEEPWDKSVKPVEGKVAQLEAELHRLRSDRGIEKVRSFFREFREEVPLSDEEWTEFTETMASQAREWGKTPQGLSVLDGMDFNHFRTLAFGKLTKEQVKAAWAREEQTKRAGKANLATDVPSRVGTTGREKPAGAQSALDAFLEGCRQEGIHPQDFSKLV